MFEAGRTHVRQAETHESWFPVTSSLGVIKQNGSPQLCTRCPTTRLSRDCVSGSVTSPLASQVLEHQQGFLGQLHWGTGDFRRTKWLVMGF